MFLRVKTLFYVSVINKKGGWTLSFLLYTFNFKLLIQMQSHHHRGVFQAIMEEMFLRFILINVLIIRA